MSLISETARYYAARAPVYDETAGYMDPAAEQLRAPGKARLRDIFRGHDVLEIACGTGYWTAVIGEVAGSVLATDVNPSVLSIAEDRCKEMETVRFQRADAYSLGGVPSGFTAALGMWWWSHVAKQAVRTFLSVLHAKLRPGSLVYFDDQLPYGGRARRQDSKGNTLERRSLPDGRSFWVIKNFTTEPELRDVLRDCGDDIQYATNADGTHWNVLYRTK